MKRPDWTLVAGAWRTALRALVITGASIRTRGPAFAVAARRVWSVINWAGFADLVALLFLAGLVLYFFRDSILDRRVFFENDTTVFYFPLSERFDQALKEGEFPVWVRSIFAGFPLFADSETGMLYPLKLLMHLWLTPWQVMVWGRIALFFIAAASMYGFGRAMGFYPFSAALAATVFTLGSFLVAQVHHGNMIRSAVLLPFVFFCVEMSLRSLGRRRLQWMVLGAMGLGMQCLGVHIQVVLMTLLSLALFLAWRWFWGPVRVHLKTLPGGRQAGLGRRLMRANANVWSALMQRTVVMAGMGGLVVLLGIGLAMVQLLPLYELAQFSNRSEGVSYQFASTYAMPKIGLLQALSPYLFRAPGGEWWTLWAPWEFTLYIGLPALIFVLMGVLFARNRYTFFFLGLLVASLLVALGPNAPVNLHEMLWELPGFSFLRAPGRFTFLTMFAAAVLAGWGAHWLDVRLSQRRRTWRSIFFSVFLALCTLLPGVLVIGSVWVRSWMDANMDEVLLLLQNAQPAGVGQAAIDRALAGLKRALDLTNPGVAVSAGLLQLTVIGLVLWYGAPHLGALSKGALLGFVSLDLLLFGAVYHRTISPVELGAPSGAAGFLMENAGGDRTLLKGSVPSLEPNRLLPYTVPTLGGYSSLAPQRNLEYVRPLRMSHDTVTDSLIDAASIRYIVADAKFPGYPSHKYSSFDPRWPLTQGLPASRDSKVVFDGEQAVGDTLAVVATLGQGVTIPQDAPLADLTVVTTTGQRRTVTLRAGRHVSEWAYEREDVKPVMRHAQVEKAFTSSERDQNGNPYPAHYYYAELPIGGPVTAQAIEYQYTYNAGNLKLYSLAVVDRPTGRFTILRNKTKYRMVYKDQEAIIYENMSPMPRAYVVGQGVPVESGNQILARMIDGGFDPRQTVLLEDVEQAGSLLPAMVSETPNVLPPPRPFFRGARFVSDEPAVSSIEYDAPSPGYLVLADSYYPGWQAYLDGERVPLYRANYLFRAIRAPAGQHTVEFRFESATLQQGLALSLFSLAVAIGTLIGVEVWALVRLLARALVPLRSAWVPPVRRWEDQAREAIRDRIAPRPAPPATAGQLGTFVERPDGWYEPPADRGDESVQGVPVAVPVPSLPQDGPAAGSGPWHPLPLGRVLKSSRVDAPGDVPR